MTLSLSEMAGKLRDYIIDSQSDVYNSSYQNFNISKYNNIKLALNESIRYPHIIISIGISKATYNIEDMIRTDGGLGPEERIVKKWLNNVNTAYELKEMYDKFKNSLGESGKIEEYADINNTARINPQQEPPKVHEGKATVENLKVSERDIKRRKRIKREIKNFLEASNRKLN